VGGGIQKAKLKEFDKIWIQIDQKSIVQVGYLRTALETFLRRLRRMFLRDLT
jgi:hypothetical protein